MNSLGTWAWDRCLCAGHYQDLGSWHAQKQIFKLLSNFNIGHLWHPGTLCILRVSDSQAEVLRIYIRDLEVYSGNTLMSKPIYGSSQWPWWVYLHCLAYVFGEGCTWGYGNFFCLYSGRDNPRASLVLCFHILFVGVGWWGFCPQEHWGYAVDILLTHICRKWIIVVLYITEVAWRCYKLWSIKIYCNSSGVTKASFLWNDMYNMIALSK